MSGSNITHENACVSLVLAACSIDAPFPRDGVFFFSAVIWLKKVSFSKCSHFLHHVKSPGFQFGDFDGKYLHNFLNYCLQTCTHRMGCVCLRLRNHKELL